MAETSKFRLIEGGDHLLGIEAVSEELGAIAADELGINADSAYVTHHDVRRAANLGAKIALEFYRLNPPIEGEA